jgi:dGTP triphosphohydrolase
MRKKLNYNDYERVWHSDLIRQMAQKNKVFKLYMEDLLAFIGKGCEN